MNFFRNLFRGQDKRLNLSSGPMPTRGLNLQFTPIPENGYKFAQQFVDAVKNTDKRELDYSVDTIDFVDDFLQGFSDEGLTVNDFAETIFVAGSYVGQVMVKNNNGIWVGQEDADLPDKIDMMPIVVKLPNGNILDPIAKAFKRFHNGDIDNIKYFYDIFTTKISRAETNNGS